MCQLALEGKEFPELGAQGSREEREQAVGKLGGHAIKSLALGLHP